MVLTEWPDLAPAGGRGALFSGVSSPATPVARHGGRAPHTLVYAYTHVDDP